MVREIPEGKIPIEFQDDGTEGGEVEIHQDIPSVGRGVWIDKIAHIQQVFGLVMLRSGTFATPNEWQQLRYQLTDRAAW